MAEKIVIPVALLGLGTVGGGVYELFKRQKDEGSSRLGAGSSRRWRQERRSSPPIRI